MAEFLPLSYVNVGPVPVSVAGSDGRGHASRCGPHVIGRPY